MGPAVGWLVIATEMAVGIAVVLGIATNAFLIVGIACNVMFLLAGAVNPAVFYIIIEGTLLLGDAGAAASVGPLVPRPTADPSFRVAIDEGVAWRSLPCWLSSRARASRRSTI